MLDVDIEVRGLVDNYRNWGWVPIVDCRIAFETATQYSPIRVWVNLGLLGFTVDTMIKVGNRKA